LKDSRSSFDLEWANFSSIISLKNVFSPLITSFGDGYSIIISSS